MSNLSSEKSVSAVIDYVVSLAPQFFAANMRGATEDEIERLENAAGTKMSDGHRTFLNRMGSTPAQALNPFLNDRDYCIDTLVAEYDGWTDADENLPAGIVYFSSSEITGENLFLKHGSTLASEPEIGDISNDSQSFIPNNRMTFQSYLAWWAFRFRCGQFEYAVDISPPWNRAENRWVGEPEKLRVILDGLNFKTRFSLPGVCEELDGAELAATFYSNGSVAIAGDDYDELVRVGDALMSELDLSLTRIPSHDRMRSPRT